MDLEIALRKIGGVRKNFHARHLDESKVFSGIKNLDKLLMGFNSNKSYTVVARKGNGIYSFANTLANNIDVLYQTNYSVLLQKNEKKATEPDDFWKFLSDSQLFLKHKEVFTFDSVKKPMLVHAPVLLIANINGLTNEEIQDVVAKSRKWWHVEVLVVFLFIVEDDFSAPLSLADIPSEIKANSDVILSLYRPEYYKIDTWEDETSTVNQIQVSILKNHKPSLGSTQLFLDKENKIVKSKNESVLSEWTDKFIQILNDKK